MRRCSSKTGGEIVWTILLSPEAAHRFFQQPHEGNSSDIHKHYGKKVFAHKVIRPNADKVDFSGFRPLLQNIGHAIAAHGKSLCAGAPVPKGSPELR